MNIRRFAFEVGLRVGVGLAVVIPVTMFIVFLVWLVKNVDVAMLETGSYILATLLVAYITGAIIIDGMGSG